MVICHSSPVSCQPSRHWQRRRFRFCLPKASSSRRVVAAFASLNLQALADAFDAELYAELLDRKECPGRGLMASHATRTAPLVVVPLASALVVADPGVPEGYQYILDSALSQVLPPGLQARMTGAMPESYALWGLPFIQLAAVLLWLRNNKARASEASHVGSLVHKSRQQYIEQVSCCAGTPWVGTCFNGCGVAEYVPRYHRFSTTLLHHLVSCT